MDNKNETIEEIRKKYIERYVYKKFTCECGGVYCISNGTKHRATKLHIDYMKNKEKQTKIVEDIKRELDRKDKILKIVLKDCEHMKSRIDNYEKRELSFMKLIGQN